MARWRTRLRITSVVATAVAVPLRQALSLPEVQQPRHVLRAGTNKGLVGLGEAGPLASLEDLRSAAQAVAGRWVDELPHSRLPVTSPHAYAAVEMLVYDILGQAAKMPVHQLLGGLVRAGVPARARLEADGEQIGALAQQAQRMGFSAMRVVCADSALAVPRMDAVRSVCANVRLMLDAQKQWGDQPQSRQVMQALSRLGLEAVLDPWAMDRTSDHAPPATPLWHSVSWLQPRLSWLAPDSHVSGFEVVGPMADSVRMADLVGDMHRRCAMAGAVDLGIAETARLHTAAAAGASTLACDLQGRWLREHDLLSEPLTLSQGAFVVPRSPGLGVQLDPDALERYRRGSDVELFRE